MHLQMHAPKAMGTTLWIGVRPRRSVVLAAAPFYEWYDLGLPPASLGGVCHIMYFSYLIEAQRRAQYRGGFAFVS